MKLEGVTMKKKDYSKEYLQNSFILALRNLGGAGSFKEIEYRLLVDLEIDENSQIDFTSTLQEVKIQLFEQSIINVSDNNIISLNQWDKNKSISNRSLTKASKNILRNESSIHIYTDLLTFLKNIEPQQFERLCLRLLKELGFRNLKHNGQVNDGGFDGYGNFVFNEILSFEVLIQAKRYKGTVGSSIIRDFRGALSGRAEKGLLITTGLFSSSAIDEANRDGAIKIDLIDGNLLCEKLMQYKLGIRKEIVEKFTIDKGWFESI